MAAILAPSFASGAPASADEGWVVRAFDVAYEIRQAGVVAVTEDLRVDFGGLERHGIFREMPYRYDYDDTSDRLITISDVRVDDGSAPVPFELIRSDTNLQIKIGDPDKLVTGERRYRITYNLSAALNPFPDHDEFFWNVTGADWPVPIEQATALVTVPQPGIERAACYEGPTGSTAPCSSLPADDRAAFRSTMPLGLGSEMTIVVGLRKGLVTVPEPALEAKPEEKDLPEYFKVTPLSVGATLALAAVIAAGLARVWWVAGRDRWFGDMAHAVDNPRAETKPLFARETVVVEYQPPEVERRGRRLRPAEIGLLVDERADTLDVSATIVDLAVRKYLVIKETEEGGVFGLFKSRDYELTKMEGGEGELLPYEQTLLDALFAKGSPVKMSDLKNEFHDDLAKVKKELYQESTKTLKFFPRDPEFVRNLYRVGGIVAAAVGAGLGWLLGTGAGGALVAVPVVLGGLVLVPLSPAMPRRTAEGRQMYRRVLGFRQYMVTAETERQRFAEEKNIFHDYLPYAIVFQCVQKWAKAFEGLEAEAQQPYWYVGTHPFVAASFAEGVRDFSTSVSSVMASTPGGRGGSGFGGGGSSGGGGGGGGGGSW